MVARFAHREQGATLAEKLRSIVESHEFDIGNGLMIQRTCSIGFTCFPFVQQQPEALSSEQMIRIADECLYAAKKARRNAWVGLHFNHSSYDDLLFSRILNETSQLIDDNILKVEASCADPFKGNG